MTQLEAQLEKEGAEISEVRQFVISSTHSRNETLLAKQIEAADALWLALLEDKKHLLLINFMKALNIDEMNAAVSNGDAENFVDIMFKIVGLEKFIDEIENMSKDEKAEHFNRAAKQRPFVSSLAWALYSAHSSITSHALVTLVSWKNGLDTKLLKNEELLKTAIKTLPHQEKFVKQYGVGGTYYLLDEIEQKLLDELRRFIRVGETDRSMATQALEILKASNEARRQVSELPPEAP